jgi:hypothetical protein
LRSACHPLALCVQRVSNFAMCAGGGTYVVERAELGGGLVQAGVGREDRAATLTLVANYPTHGDVLVGSRRLSMLNSRRDVVGAIAKFSLIAEFLLWTSAVTGHLHTCILSEHHNIHTERRCNYLFSLICDHYHWPPRLIHVTLRCIVLVVRRMSRLSSRPQ